MTVVSLLYHDVVDGDPDSSGFAGRAAGVYKLDLATFREHLAALAEIGRAARAAVTSLTAPRSFTPLLLTFDDGGVSAHSVIADELEDHGWIGHFFITAERIGTRGFLDVGQIRDLSARGHLIGAHSWSHPPRISALDPARLLDEWERGAGSLAEILGSSVETASVPGGYTSAAVIRAAERAGIRFLFTSEPNARVRFHGACRVFGRFAIMRSTPSALAASLAAGTGWSRQRQWVAWNIRKTLKVAAGPMYDRARDSLFELRVGR